MIKAGQIYKEDEYIICITCVYGSVKVLVCDVIDKHGFTYHRFSKEIEDNEDIELIAEYPTWQEAVNSKEFRDER